MAIAFFANAEGRRARETARAGVCQAARERGVAVVVYSSPTVSAFAKLDAAALREIYAFSPADFEGVVMAYPSPALMAYGQELHRRGYPVVNIARPGEVPNVTIENFAVFERAARAFAAAGHREIVFLEGPKNNPSADLRRNGFLAGLAAAGLSSEGAALPGGAFSQTASYRIVRECWQRGRRFTALAAANDASAIGALLALQELGVRVPDDVEILGFDDLPPAKWTTPSLSSFSSPEFEMGYRAVELLLNPTVGNVVLPVSFVRRGSTRPATQIASDVKITAPWQVHPERARREVALLRRHPPAARMLDCLQAGVAWDAAVASEVASLIEACDRLEISVASVCATVTESSRPEAPTSHSGSEIAEALRAAVFHEQRRSAEIAAEFDVLLRPLRQMTLEAAEERNILETFGHTLGELGVRHAELILSAPKSGEAPPPARSYLWRSDGNGQPLQESGAGDRFEVRRALSRPDIDRGMFVAPLLHSEEPFGLLALDLHCRYREMYPDLTRQLTIALQTARSSQALTDAHRRLVESSHYAGMAEVATGVLHNVGNVLNSLNVSIALLERGLAGLKIDTLEKIGRFLHEREADLGRFLTEDPKGRRLPELLDSLAAALMAERTRLVEEAKGAGQSVDHIKQIVAEQQAYATTVRFVEPIDAKALMEDALRLNFGALLRHHVRIDREYAEAPPIEIEKAKALQILVNLIQNAKQACDSIEQGDRVLTLRIRCEEPGRVALEVADNGAGISADDLSRIFTHGFTKKPGGHGFGLHFAALAAKAMGGDLKASSAGLGHGATFTLRLPTTNRDSVRS